MAFLQKFFRKRELGRLEQFAAEAGEREPRLKELSDDELKEQSATWKDQARNQGELPEEADAFALVREAAWRTLGQRPYDVQLMGGLVLHEGSIAEMVTGEGKTLAAVAPVYFNALKGSGIHVVTVNDYLAKRDVAWMGQVYHFLGLTVSCIAGQNEAYIYDPTYVTRGEGDQGGPGDPHDHDKKERSGTDDRESALLDEERDATGSFRVQHEYLRPTSRREAYRADITYGTSHQFGFDYLRDNLAQSIEGRVQRGQPIVVIDEIDSVLIDEARTPMIISAPDKQSSKLYSTFARAVKNLRKEEDYEVDEKKRTVLVNESGIEKVEKLLGIDNMYAPENLRMSHYLEESLKAKELFQKDKEYVVRDGEIVLVDTFTGRMLPGRRYSGGLHQAIEAKEGVTVKEESRTLAKVSVQNYFRMYNKIAGMTGTAQSSAEEFDKVYSLQAVTIPTNKPLARKSLSDVIYKSSEGRWNAVVEKVKELRQAGQPVLIGTTSIEKNELIADKLARANVPHEVLNAKRHEKEAETIAQAGQPGAVTVATNIAGRGVDIILGGNPPDEEEAKKVREAGGLFVIGTERHEARRIDNQLRGRAGRQGDPGASQFFLSLEDDLLRIFGGEKLQHMMERFDLPDDQPIQAGFITKLVEQAQAKVEGRYFDMRKHLLDYDDVLNRQREAFYGRRNEILASLSAEHVASHIRRFTEKYFDPLFDAIEQMDNIDDRKEVEKLFREAGLVAKEQGLPEDWEVDDARGIIIKKSEEVAHDPHTRLRMLKVMDMLWMEHLENLEATQESVRLRAHAQRDPLVEYREEARRLLQGMWANFREWLVTNLFNLANSQEPRANSDTQTDPESKQSNSLQPLSPEKTKNVGRNDKCPCGSGKKYKKCHGG